MKKNFPYSKFRPLKKRLKAIRSAPTVNRIQLDDDTDDCPTDDDDPPATEADTSNESDKVSDQSGETSGGTEKPSRLKKQMKAKKAKKQKARKLRSGDKPKATSEERRRTDIDFGDNLWECIDTVGAGAWLARQQALFNEKATKGYRRKRLDEAIRIQADALLLAPGSIDGAYVVDDELTTAAFDRLHRQMTDYLVRNPDDDLLFVTIITGDVGTSLDRPEIRLKQIKQQANSILRKLGPNHFGMLDISCFSNIRHESGGRHVQPHVHALVFGPGIAGRSWRVTGKASRMLTQNVTEIDPLRVINVTDKSAPNLSRLSAYLLKPPAKCKNWYRRDDGKAIMNHSNAGQRYIRYTRMAQIRSLLSFEDVALAGGDGVAIRGSLVTDLRGLAKAAARSSKPMHPDELHRFWNDFNRAIGKDRFAVPVILRK